MVMRSPFLRPLLVKKFENLQTSLRSSAYVMLRDSCLSLPSLKTISVKKRGHFGSKSVPEVSYFVTVSSLDVTVKHVVAQIGHRLLHPLNEDRTLANVEVVVKNGVEFWSHFPVEALAHVVPKLGRIFD